MAARLRLLIRHLTDHSAAPFLFFGGLTALLLLDQVVPIRLIPPCPLRFLTGLQCPGCGSGHAALAILQGDPLNAFLANPFMTILIPLVLIAAAHDFVRPRTAVMPRLPGWSIYLLAAAMVLFTIVRNLLSFESLDI